MPYCAECGIEFREGVVNCSDCGATLEPGPLPPDVYGPAWVPVAAFTSPEEAFLARGFLAEQGIEADVISAERSIFPIHRVVASDTVLAVPPDDAATARALLQQAERGAVLLPEEDPAESDVSGNA